ncbi:hypothetical protein KFK09_019950 [Dendrobium nobile]|uniref:Uncharacterized protein n=1 Tax=Dendrobium nobile TaxID=94219 RepID=A0A8T3ARX5_DENNO|nr:hypothetical protein KFK09_019950 [Dendrobium nobile]
MSQLPIRQEGKVVEGAKSNSHEGTEVATRAICTPPANQRSRRSEVDQQRRNRRSEVDQRRRNRSSDLYTSCESTKPNSNDEKKR